MMADHAKELSAEYIRLKKEKERIPYASEFPFRYWAIATYGSWNAFVSHEEHRSIDHHQNNYISNTQLIYEIKDLRNQLHYPPHPKDYKRTVTAITKFGSWRSFLKAADIKTTYLYPDKGNSYVTLEEIDYRIKTILEKNKGKITDRILRQEGFPISSVYKYFGSLKALKNHYHLKD